MGKTAVKRKRLPKKSDKEQFGRLVEAARKLGVNESIEDFAVTFKKIVPPKRRK